MARSFRSIQIIVGTFIVAIIEFVFDMIAIKADPQQQHISIRCCDIAGSQDGRGLLETHVIAIDEVDMLLIIPCTMTTLHQGVPIESPQPRKGRDKDMGAFVQPHRPAVVYLFKDGRRAFDNRYFFIHSIPISILYGATSYHKKRKPSCLDHLTPDNTYKYLTISLTSPGPR